MQEHSKCLACGEASGQVANLGVATVGVPLILMQCFTCGLVQVKDVLDRTTLLSSSIQNKDRDALLAVVQKAKHVIEFNPEGEKVLDIGCGNGALLGWYNKGTVTVGVDPNYEIVKPGLEKKAIDVAILDFFSADVLRNNVIFTLSKEQAKFKIITAVSVLDEVEHPVTFIRHCKELLADEGVLMIQVNYWPTMLSHTIELINHNKISYFTVASLERIITKVGLIATGVEITKNDEIRMYCINPVFAERFGSNSGENKLWLYSNMQMKKVSEMQLAKAKDDSYKVLEASIAESKTLARQ